LSTTGGREVKVRGKGQRAKVVQTPFYPSKVKKG
jgi:hypothetical protein